jgi:threonine dehydrogenase-like Zn-dependent dehydrogenase
MAETCRGAVFAGDGTFAVREFPVPDPPPGGAVLRTEAVGLCGSDIAQFHGTRLTPASTFPTIPGHEIVGRIAKLSTGAAATWGLAEGDRVAVDEVLTCGTCPGCTAGEMCHRMRVYGYEFSADEPPFLFGGYGEYMVLLPGTRLYRLPESIPAEELTLFEPLANSMNWVQAIRPGDTVVVQGPGHQGLTCVVAARSAGAGRIIVTGTSADRVRLDAALAIGASDTIVVDVEDAVERVGELTGERMADVVMDVASVTQTVNLALELVRARGHVVLAGLKHFTPNPGLVTDWIPLKGLTIHGGCGFTPESMQKAVDLLAAGTVDTATLLGDVYPMDEIERAMAVLDRGIPGHDAVRVGLKLS